MRVRTTLIIGLLASTIYGFVSAEDKRKEVCETDNVYRCALLHTFGGRAGHALVVGGAVFLVFGALSPFLVTRTDRKKAELKALKKRAKAQALDDEIDTLKSKVYGRSEPSL